LAKSARAICITSVRRARGKGPNPGRSQSSSVVLARVARIILRVQVFEAAFMLSASTGSSGCLCGMSFTPDDADDVGTRFRGCTDDDREAGGRRKRGDGLPVNVLRQNRQEVGFAWLVGPTHLVLLYVAIPCMTSVGTSAVNRAGG